MRESQLLTHDLSRGTGGTKPSLVHVVEALHTRVLLPGHQVSPKSTTWLATKAHHKGTCQAPLVALMLPPLRTFSTKGGGLHVPCTKCHRISKPERRRLLPESHLGSKASSTLCTTWSTRKSSHKVLCIQLSFKLSLAPNTLTKHVQKPWDEPNLSTSMAWMWSLMCLELL
jgi:hypothetical protein